jgi:hypothetical protein
VVTRGPLRVICDPVLVVAQFDRTPDPVLVVAQFDRTPDHARVPANDHARVPDLNRVPNRDMVEE